MFLSKDRVDNFIDFVLLLINLVIDDYDCSQLLPCVENILLGYLLAENSLDFVCNAFTKLVVFVDVFVVLGESVVAVNQHFIASLQFYDMLGHSFVLIYHCSEFKHLAGQFLSCNFKL